ncbi:MAG TPA: AMP-binding protein, partial [Candidatus Bipolaricaulota bacterium]
MEVYQKLYQQSVQDNEGFWAKQAERLVWSKKWNKVRDVDYAKAHIRWFEGGQLNVCYNCLDRHVEAGHGSQIALVWEGNDPAEDREITYRQLLDEVAAFANALKAQGVHKGDRVCIYLQMIPQLAVAMLACARIGAVHSIVFGAFSASALRDRINDSRCKVLVTQDTGVRGAKHDIPMKANADQAVSQCPSIEKVIVV